MPTRCDISLVLAAALVGCSGATTPAPVDPPAAVGVAEAPTPLPDLVQACSGTAIDLRWIADNLDACALEEGTWLEELPSGALGFRVDPAVPRVVAGQTAVIDYVLTNATQAPLAVQLGVFCTVRVATATIVDAHGDPVDVVCGGGGGCGDGGTVIPLKPGSDARIRLEVPAVRNLQDDDCGELRPEPLEPGEYRIEINLGSDLPVLEVPLVVDSESV